LLHPSRFAEEEIVNKTLREFFLGLYAFVLAAFLAIPVLAQTQPKKVEPKPEGQSEPKNFVKDVANDLNDKARGNSWLATTAALIGLIGTGVPVLAKTLETISLRSRRKQDLDRITDLTELMKKIKEEEILSKSTLDAVCEQIDAEIRAALAGLARTREHRQLVVDKRKERQDPQLTFTRSSLLLFRPHGVRAWIAHLLAYWWAFCTMLFCLPVAVDSETRSVFAGLALFTLLLFLLSRMWALRLRSQWSKGHLAVIGEPVHLQQEAVNS
jgi:hypothetical protein